MREDLREKGLTFCGGNPLIIRSFLQCMETKHTLKEWEEMVSERDNSVFRRPETLEIQKTLEIITSTYHDLPHDLLPFFLYMGVLQEEDLRVDAEKLYLLSLADGLLKPLQREEERPLDTAQRCITEVAQKTMMDLDEGEEPTITRFKYCSARFKYCSEIIRDLSLLKNKDEGFFKFVDFTSESLLVSDSFSSSSEFRTCRAAINLDKYEEGHRFSLQDNEIRHMRVLLFSAKKKKTWPRKVSSLVKFKFLRVLDFNGINFELTRLPKGIGRAIHLRYLSFKDCVLPKLPASIGNLKFLCILDLRAQHSPKMIIPNVLWKMKKLKHLFFPQLFRTHNASKLRLDGLTELETITNFNVAMSSVKDLFEMPKLQYLDANVVGNLEELEGVIERMMNSDVNLLRTSLDVKNFDCYTEKRHSAFRKLLAYQSLTALCMEGHIRHMPIYHNFSMNLSKIVFTGSGLVEDPMATLEKLPKLRVLVLDDAFVGEKIVCSASGFVDLEKNETAPGFAELKVLKLLNLHQLKEWIMEDGAMPKLSTVVIASCGQLAKLPGILQCAPWSSAKDESLTNARRFSKQDSRGNRPSTCHNHIRGLITSPDDMHIS